MPLNDQEKAKCLYHLGYHGVAIGPSIQFGMARPVQSLFLVQQALVNVQEIFVDRIRSILIVLEGVESKLIDAQDRLAAEQLEQLHINLKEPDDLEKEYVRWARRLADILAVPLYPYSARFKEGAGVVAGSIPVRN